MTTYLARAVPFCPNHCHHFKFSLPRLQSFSHLTTLGASQINPATGGLIMRKTIVWVLFGALLVVTGCERPVKTTAEEVALNEKRFINKRVEISGYVTSTLKRKRGEVKIWGRPRGGWIITCYLKDKDYAHPYDDMSPITLTGTLVKGEKTDSGWLYLKDAKIVDAGY